MINDIIVLLFIHRIVRECKFTNFSIMGIDLNGKFTPLKVSFPKYKDFFETWLFFICVCMGIGSVAEFLTFADHGYAVFHPFGHRVALQVMVEELLEANGDVLPVAALLDVVGLAVVL